MFIQRYISALADPGMGAPIDQKYGLDERLHAGDVHSTFDLQLHLLYIS